MANSVSSGNTISVAGGELYPEYGVVDSPCRIFLEIEGPIGVRDSGSGRAKTSCGAAMDSVLPSVKGFYLSELLEPEEIVLLLRKMVPWISEVGND